MRLNRLCRGIPEGMLTYLGFDDPFLTRDLSMSNPWLETWINCQILRLATGTDLMLEYDRGDFTPSNKTLKPNSEELVRTQLRCTLKYYEAIHEIFILILRKLTLM